MLLGFSFVMFIQKKQASEKQAPGCYNEDQREDNFAAFSSEV